MARLCFLSLLLRSRPLLRAALWLNYKVANKAGVRITLTDSLVVSKDWPDRLLYFERLLSLVEHVRGDVVECGVYWGNSLLILAVLNRNRTIKRHIWGFDSFEGLPTPTNEDVGSSASAARRGMFGEASEEAVLRNLRSAGVDENTIREQVTIVKGWFSDALPRYNGSIALLHMDADLYESTKCALENLWPKVTVGGIATFDEYASEEWPGERKAVDEYFGHDIEEGNVRMCRDFFYDRYYAVKLK